MEATLKFTYVEKYPDEPPQWEIFSQENLEDTDVEDILALLLQQVCLSELKMVSLIDTGSWSLEETLWVFCLDLSCAL